MLENLSLSKFFIIADTICDYIPGVSLITNGIELLVRKYLFKEPKYDLFNITDIEKKTIHQKDSQYPLKGYIKHIQTKEESRCYTCLLPIFGNVYIIYTDVKDYFFKNHDIRAMLGAVKEDGLQLDRASNELKKNELLVLTAIAQNFKAVQFVHKDLQKDTSFLNKLLDESPKGFKYLIDQLKKSDEVFLKDYISQYPEILEKWEISLEDKNLILGAIQKNKAVFKHLPPEFRENDEFFKKALKANISVLEIVQEEAKIEDEREERLRKEKEKFFQLEQGLISAPNGFDVDAELSTQPINISGEIRSEDLEIAHPNVTNVMHEKIPQVPQPDLKQPSSKISSDNTFIEIAAKHIVDTIRDNIAQAESKGVKRPDPSVYAPFRAVTDESLALRICELLPQAFRGHNNLFDREKFILKVVEKNAEILNHISRDYETDDEFFLLAIERNSNAIKYIPKAFKSDDFMEQAFKRNPNIASIEIEDEVINNLLSKFREKE